MASEGKEREQERVYEIKDQVQDDRKYPLWQNKFILLSLYLVGFSLVLLSYRFWPHNFLKLSPVFGTLKTVVPFIVKF